MHKDEFEEQQGCVNVVHGQLLAFEIVLDGREMFAQLGMVLFPSKGFACE